MSQFADIPAATQERLAVRVRDIMRPGVIAVGEHASLMQAKRAMVRHGVHAVLVVGDVSGMALGWVSDSGLLRWLERDLDSVPAAHAITEPPRYIDPDASARDALEQLAEPGTTHLLAGEAGRFPQGVVAPLDLVDLVTRP